MTYQNSKSEFPDGLFVFEAFADTDEKTSPKGQNRRKQPF